MFNINFNLKQRGAGLGLGSDKIKSKYNKQTPKINNHMNST